MMTSIAIEKVNEEIVQPAIEPTSSYCHADVYSDVVKQSLISALTKLA